MNDTDKLCETIFECTRALISAMEATVASKDESAGTITDWFDGITEELKFSAENLIMGESFKEKAGHEPKDKEDA